MNRKFTSTVAGASILLTSVGLLSRGLGLVREIVFAGSFGLGEEFDIYLVGAVLPLTIQVIILFLIQNYLIPSYNHLLAKSPEKKESFIRSNFWIFCFGGTVLAIILYFSSGFIISTYLSGSSIKKQEEARLIFNIFLITLPFSAANSVLISFLQNKLNFFTPAIARLTTNLAVISIVFFLSTIYGTFIIPIGYVIGEIIQFIILLSSIKMNLFPSFKNLIVKEHLKNSLSLNLFLIIVIESISQLYAISDRYFISSVHEGGIAALNYSQTLFTLPIITISLALSTAIFPSLSKNYSSGAFDELKRQFFSGIRVNILIFVPLMLIFYFNGNEIIRIIYEHGKFNSSNTIMTAETLKYFSISLVFYSMYSIINKIIYSAQWIKALLILTLLGISIKIILNFILVGIFSQNGLALSSSISYIFFFAGSFFIINKRLSFTFAKEFFGELFLHVVCSLITYTVIFLVLGFNIRSSTLTTSFVLISFCLVYMLNLWLLKTKSIEIIIKLLASMKNSI